VCASLIVQAVSQTDIWYHVKSPHDGHIAAPVSPLDIVAAIDDLWRMALS
jgi:hypothetical protein